MHPTRSLLLAHPADDDAALRRAERLLDHLAAHHIRTDSVAGLIAGAHTAPASLVIAPHNAEQLARWIDVLAPTAATAYAVIPAARLAEDPAFARALAQAAGFGVVALCAGQTGAPLRGLSAAALRAALAASRDALEHVCGYPIRGLWCAPDAHGRALDGLILAEALDAGLTTLRAPGFGVDHALARLGALDAARVIWTRNVTDSRPAEVTRWLTRSDVLTRAEATFYAIRAGLNAPISGA
jgi:hypothetical protein